MNVVTFLLKGNKRSKSAITAAIFLLGLTAMWGINKGYQKLTHMEEIQVAPDEAVYTNTSIKNNLISLKQSLWLLVMKILTVWGK